MYSNRWFVKVSGLIVTKQSTLEKLANELIALLDYDITIQLTLVSGGGEAVDGLRENFQKLISPDKKREEELQAEYHWRSIDIMDSNGNRMRQYFASRERVSIPRIRNELEAHPPGLPETWEISSDSITYWLACHDGNGSPKVVLLKDTDGVLVSPTRGEILRRTLQPRGTVIKEIIVHDGVPFPLCSSYPFDAHLFKLVDRYHVPFYVVNSNHVERLRFLAENRDDFPFTRVIYEERSNPKT
nr:hypothetical protein [Candidatus Sigynarchaeota archaeon]